MRTVFPDEAEERLKTEFFGPHPGFFVDVGANDPRVGSQTWALEQAGWRGILIEPQPDLAARLKRERAAQVFAAACSSPANAGKTMPLHLAGMHSSLDRGSVSPGTRPSGTVQVPIRTLDDILEEAGAPSRIDFLSIDVEGHEADVLAGLDRSRWRVRLLLLEDHVRSLSAHHLLVRSGFRLVRRTGLNGWYVPADAAPKLGIVGQLALLRKYYLAFPIRLLRDKKRRWLDAARGRS